MRPAVSHKNGTFQAGRTCRIRARGHRKIKAVFPHPGGFSAYMFLHCRAGRNLHSNYTLKLAKCKERYAFFSRIVQNIDFIFRVFHKKRSAFSTKTGGFLESAPADRRKREFFAKKRFPQVFCGKHLRRHPKWFSTMLKTVPDCRGVPFPQSCGRSFPLWGMRTLLNSLS